MSNKKLVQELYDIRETTFYCPDCGAEIHLKAEIDAWQWIVRGKGKGQRQRIIEATSWVFHCHSCEGTFQTELKRHEPYPVKF